MGRALHKVVAYAKCMDKRGYDTFWMAEHHFQPEGTELIPNVLMMAMHLCGVTNNLRIGCGFNIVPMRHPLRLAEDSAMADILTGGRVIFGAGPRKQARQFRCHLVLLNAAHGDQSLQDIRRQLLMQLRQAVRRPRPKQCGFSPLEMAGFAVAENSPSAGELCAAYSCL
jgi:alkanesulfonate monooxygenase SsuD/methylene tetrahydromethanopterin reductase-like flavin-dependent oxidoreductase (luciferase family)